jgi:hypothetical protein
MEPVRRSGKMKKTNKDQIHKLEDMIGGYYQSVLEGPKQRLIDRLREEHIISFLKNEMIKPYHEPTKTLPVEGFHNGMTIASSIYDMTRPGCLDGFLKTITNNVTRWLDALLDEKYKSYFVNFIDASTINNLIEKDLASGIDEEKQMVCLAASYGAGAFHWLKKEAPLSLPLFDFMTSPGFKEFYLCYNELFRMHQGKSSEKAPKRERIEEIMEAIQELVCDERNPVAANPRKLYEQFRDRKQVGQVHYKPNETAPRDLRMGLLEVPGKGTIKFETFRKYIQEFNNENEID